jgi:hypothetical protein
MTATAVELKALKALHDALWAVQRAELEADLAGYGSEVRGSLDQARQALAYALAVAEGRT